MNKLNRLLLISLIVAGITAAAGDLTIEGNLCVTNKVTGKNLVVTNAFVETLVVTNATVKTLVVASSAVVNGSITIGTGGSISGDGSGLVNLNPSVTVPAGSVNETRLADNAVTTAKIFDGAVTAEKLGTGSVTSLKLADGTIVDADIAVGAAISQAKIQGLDVFVIFVNSHINDNSNPHQVTAMQLNAYTSAETDTKISQALAGFDLSQTVMTNASGDAEIVGLFTAMALKGDGSSVTNLDLSFYVGDNLTWDDVNGKLNAAPGYSNEQAVFALTNQWPSLVDGDSLWTGTSSGLDAGMARTSLGLGSAALSNAVVFAPADLSGYASDTVTYDGRFHAASQMDAVQITNIIVTTWQNVDTNSLDDITVNGGVMAADLDMGEHNVTRLALAVDEGDAVSKSYLRKVLTALPPQGGLSMGSYTNGCPASFVLEFQ